jgi:hypothetical protein
LDIERHSFSQRDQQVAVGHQCPEPVSGFESGDRAWLPNSRDGQRLKWKWRAGFGEVIEEARLAHPSQRVLETQIKILLAVRNHVLADIARVRNRSRVALDHRDASPATLELWQSNTNIR